MSKGGARERKNSMRNREREEGREKEAGLRLTVRS